MLINFKDIPEERDYDKYLRSDKWKSIRNEVLERDGHKCKFCSATENLRVHHKSYECLYEEELALNDLITLCDKCHSELHETLNGEIGQKIKKEIEILRLATYYRLKDEVMQIIIDNLGMHLLKKSKKRDFLYTYFTTFWNLNFSDKKPCIYFSFSGQNAYCKMKDEELIK